MSVPVVHGVMQKHRGFVLFVSLGFALLYAELAWFMHASLQARPADEARIVIAAVFLIAFAGHFTSFLPAKSFGIAGAETRASLTLPELTAQLGKGAGVVVGTGVICLALTLYVGAFDPVAAYTALNNIYVFALAGAGLGHVLVAYVRYGAFLYAVKQDSWVKVLVTSVGIGVVILAAFLFLITLDINWLNGAPPGQRGLYGLHVYGRDLFFFTVVIAMYGWHARWMADH